MKVRNIYILREDSTGNMVRLLKVPREWAQALQKFVGKNAFAFANIMKLYGEYANINPFEDDPNDIDGSVERLVKSTIDELHKRTEAGGYYNAVEDMPPGLYSWNYSSAPNSAERIKACLNSVPKIAAELTKVSPNLEQLSKVHTADREKRDADFVLNDDEIMRTELKTSDGWRWVVVDAGVAYGMADAMQNCGTTTGDGTVLVLVDKTSRPQIWATIEDDGSLEYVVGKGNSVPNKKLMPRVQDLMNQTGRKLHRGEKSLGFDFDNLE